MRRLAVLSVIKHHISLQSFKALLVAGIAIMAL
jgi:hypothetical protein